LDTRKSISVIIPNYNCRRQLEETLPYTYAAIKNAAIVYEIIIVDDCSNDGSVEFIRSQYPEIVIVVNPGRKGLAYSYNRGIASAQHELILLLNAGIKLTADYFEFQWKYFMAWDTFGVMGRIIDMEGQHIQEAARVPKFSGFNLNTDYFYYTTNERDRLCTLYLSGANALISAEKLKQIGGFYELFSSAHCGDMELSMRAWRIKWKCYYEHNAVCRRADPTIEKSYDGSASLNSVYYRDLFYFHALHLNGIALKLWYLQITIAGLLPKLLAGKTWIWKSYMDMLRNEEIAGYKGKIAVLLDENDSYVSLTDVCTKIKNYVKHKRNMVRFKADRD
jgi:GT2 family glycosyltransferase